jgi:nucleotide-binding universal stress UspA family protein
MSETLSSIGLRSTRVVHHLRHHGIAARTEETLRGRLAVSDILLARAADLTADLIVSGGYHHSPLREALVGGVSRELLEHMTRVEPRAGEGRTLLL